MARRTNLYQAPRSPLIQGRTRWERPLWQAWLIGAAISGALLTTVMLVRTASRRVPFVADAALAWMLVGAIIGAGLGSLLGRLWGWRMRWVAAALFGLAGGALVYAVRGLLVRGWSL